MNLELLDPFRRQIPDRVDSTLSLPSNLHPSFNAARKSRSGSNVDVASTAGGGGDDDSVGSGGGDNAVSSGNKPSSKSTADQQQQLDKQSDDDHEGDEWKAAYHIAFNRRGTYLAVGHAKGTVAVHDFLSRTLSALYRPPEADETQPPISFPNGVTSVSWSRRSRTLLAGAVGDTHARLFDTTHPLGPDECCPCIDGDGTPAALEADDMAGKTNNSSKPTISFAPADDMKENIEMTKQPRRLEVKQINLLHNDGKGLITSNSEKGNESGRRRGDGTGDSPKRRYATLLWDFPEPIGGSLQIHPRDSTTGVAVLSSGSLVLFRAPPSAWVSPVSGNDQNEPVVKFVTFWDVNEDSGDSKDDHPITCAAFSPYGDKLYAATQDGILLGFYVKDIIISLKGCKGGDDIIKINKKLVRPAFQILVPGGATAWHLIISRNGKFLLINCSDGALRLYNTTDCWKDNSHDKMEEKSGNFCTSVKPTFVFQDVVSKAPFASCDFSGDGEYVVGGCNGDNEKYELYLWNTTTGALMDRLTGAQVSLYSVTWHPTRSFLAVATSDGLVDIWGPRMDWTAFAPDFQALPMNVEYVEREDEFDIVGEKLINDGQEDLSGTATIEVDEGLNADETVDVISIDPVPVFASDSESESEVFYFDTKIKNIMAGRGRNATQGWKGDKED